MPSVRILALFWQQVCGQVHVRRELYRLSYELTTPLDQPNRVTQ